VEIRALRIRVSVERGGARYELAALVAPPNGAEPVRPVEIRKRNGDRAGGSAQASASVPPPSAASPENRKTLNYPFTLLEMTENVVLSVEHAPDTTL
jgi:general secretion pathway protein K